MEQATEPALFTGVAEQDLPAHRPHHEGEIEDEDGQGVEAEVGLAHRAQALLVVEANVGQDHDQQDGQDGE